MNLQGTVSAPSAFQSSAKTAESIHEIFERQARKTPNAVALTCGETAWTYRELNERANQVAHFLLRLGVGRETSYVPLDAAYPKARLLQMIEDAQPALIITQESLGAHLANCASKLVVLDAVAPAKGAFTSQHLGNLPDTQRLAYVIYTSGSTGRPKAVRVVHRAVVNLLTSGASTLGINDQDNLLAITTLSFDIAALEIFLPLITGGHVTLATREQAGDGTQLSNLIESSKATWMQGTPATWKLLLEAGWGGNKNLNIICGGEALKRLLADELLLRVKTVWNFYGPTETTIWSTCWRVRSGESIYIGKPLANTQLYILDSSRRLVPIGTVGELYIGATAWRAAI